MDELRASLRGKSPCLDGVRIGVDYGGLRMRSQRLSIYVGFTFEIARLLHLDRVQR